MRKTLTLSEARPDLLKDWDYEKNHGISPSTITCGSKRKVWWKTEYYDNETGKKFVFEWRSSIHNRCNGCGCPYLSGKKVLQGFNDLQTKRPDLAVEWHPTRNGEKKPTDVTCKSNQKIWWQKEYYDKETNKTFIFEWEASIALRCNGRGCPYLSGKKVLEGFNDLQTKRPDIAAEWHPTKNKDKRPTDFTCGSKKKAWWQKKYYDKETGKTFIFEWEASIALRCDGRGCPYLSGNEVMQGFNDLQTKRPDLAAEWHPTKNKNKKPTDVTWKSDFKAWWQVVHYDKELNRTFEFEWQTTVGHRVDDTKCPYLSGKKVYKGYNDLESRHPELAKEWNYEKNGELFPSQVSYSSGQRVWWFLNYQDPLTGKEFHFEWKASIDHRIRGEGCPYLCGKKVLPGFNDLESKYPELASQWDYDKNEIGPNQICCKSNKTFFWKYSYHDPISEKDFIFEWQATVAQRIENPGCPFLSNQRVWSGFNDLATVAPEIAIEYDTERNMMPVNKISGTSKRKVWWECPYCHKKTYMSVSQKRKAVSCHCIKL